MVSRTPKPMITRRRSALDLKKGRPKRNVSPKNLDDSVSGLSWREERELKKALYASLQESRRASRDDRPEDADGDGTGDSTDPESSQSPSRSSQSPSRGPKFLDESSCSQDSNKSFIISNKEKDNEIKKTKFHAQRKFAVNSFATLRSESLRCEARGSDSSLLSYQKKIHAQRKFAQGSVPSTPSETPSKPKLKVSPVKLFPVRPKTEDFLTYLCFRGTSVLPPHLDLMNVRKEDYDPGTLLMNGRSGFTRDSSPASSSSMSHNNEDSNDMPDIAPKWQTPNKKAARASASTPETARGFFNLRHSRNGKSSTLSRSKLSPLTASHRKRLEDSYQSSKMKKKSPHKGSVSDRLALKRKAMATLTAARRSSPQKQGLRKMKSSMSEGELLTRKTNFDCKNLGMQNCLENNFCMAASDMLPCDPDHEKENSAHKTSNIDVSCEGKEMGSTTFSLTDDCEKTSIASDENLGFHNEHKISDDAADGHKQIVGCQCELDNELMDDDSGIQISFEQGPDDRGGIGVGKSLDCEMRDNNNKCKVTEEKRSDLLYMHVSVEAQRCNQHINDNSELITSLFNPLPSELDESLDIERDLDISLNQSLNVNEMLHLKESSTFLGQCKTTENHFDYEKTNPTLMQANHKLFKPAFDDSPKATGKTPKSDLDNVPVSGAKMTTNTNFERMFDQVESVVINGSLLDHNYCKFKKDVKFKIKSSFRTFRTHGSRLLCSSPVSGEGDSFSLPETAGFSSQWRGGSKRCCPRNSENDRCLEQNKKFQSINGKDNKTISSTSKSEQTRKRKSTSDVQDKSSQSPSKRPNLRNSKRVENTSKAKLKSSKLKSKSRFTDSMESHPKKLLGTGLKVKKTYKPHRPMTRASSHLKSMLKAAKMAASKKLRLVKNLGKSSQTSSKSSSKVKKLPEQKKRLAVLEKKKLSSESSGSNSSLGSNASGEIRIKTEQFPGEGDGAAVVQCPTYYPSEEQFRDPILYIQSIEAEAEQYGMCKIVPPCSWKMESRDLEDFRFATQIQYIHKLQHKWSPITEQLEYIKKLNEDNGREQFQVPRIGGVELDLVKLYELVQKYGGMKGTVGKEKKWMKIADAMKIPKQADRVSKLYAAYCKYLLAYETHTDEETDKLVDAVQAEKNKQEKNKSPPLCYKCIHKGKSQPLSSFHRAARNSQLLFGRENCNNPDDIESDYWDIVKKSDDHISVQAASLDTSIYGSMFPVRRDNPYARHGWNLHNFVESKGSILDHLGLIAGVTVPTLHIGMLYTTKCLSCNGHNLPTVQYLHQGPGLIWYAVPKQETNHLKSAIKQTVPTHVREKGFCVQQDSVMVPPNTLKKKGVSMSRCVQTSREFVVVFSSVNYSNISIGYNLSESVHYGTQDWIPYGCQAAKDLSVNYDVELFSMDAMLVFLARDSTTSEGILTLLLPFLEKVVDREISDRKKLSEAGLKETERLHDKLTKPAQKTEVLEEIIICDVSNKICYLSMVLNSHENSAFSLDQGLLHIQKKKKNLKHCKLMYRYSEEELKSLVKDVKVRLKGSYTSSPASSSPKRKGTRKTETKSSPSK